MKNITKADGLFILERTYRWNTMQKLRMERELRWKYLVRAYWDGKELAE